MIRSTRSTKRNLIRIGLILLSPLPTFLVVVALYIVTSPRQYFARVWMEMKEDRQVIHGDVSSLFTLDDLNLSPLAYVGIVSAIAFGAGLLLLFAALLAPSKDAAQRTAGPC